jgi:hypothetical protein
MAVKEQLSLAQITRREVDLYGGGGCANCRSYPILDDENQIYAAVVIPDDRSWDQQGRTAYIAVIARVVGDYVVIEEDRTLDKPLVDALMINGEVPREKIILAYKGEKLPDKA